MLRTHFQSHGKTLSHGEEQCYGQIPIKQLRGTLSETNYGETIDQITRIAFGQPLPLTAIPSSQLLGLFANQITGEKHFARQTVLQRVEYMSQPALLLDIADSVTQPTPDFDNVIAWDKKWKTSRPLVPSINKTITKLTKMDSYIQMRTTITMISEHHQMTNPSLSHGGLVLTLKQIDGTYLEVQANIQLSQHLLDCIDHTVNQDNVGSQSEETHLSINPLGLDDVHKACIPSRPYWVNVSQLFLELRTRVPAEKSWFVWPLLIRMDSNPY
ncbi:hypothetical protein T265_03896 [Opisthorchis viverrini]|uniref:Uncharacterized protein n=1 Tax=Opisthorchis viverrini TaxID=6198 RepID=A0A074ZQ21_OPIVI|nr:hypothetical protein T265_03896 [Opisthorchis viverrini]KER29523.1 hypothetical protein T265_03896 [Opisthorchis viverrini]